MDKMMVVNGLMLVVISLMFGVLNTTGKTKQVLLGLQLTAFVAQVAAAVLM